MSDTPAAIALTWGRLRLMVGSEAGITAMEIVTPGDQVRLGPNDLPGAARQLGEMEGLPGDWEANLIIDSSSGERVATATQDVAVDNYGPHDSAISIAVRELDPAARKGIVAESAFAAWRQRLADAADSLDQLTTADAKIVGPLSIPGSPLLTELRAARRRSLNAPTNVTGDAGDALAAAGSAIGELRAAVRYGAAGLAEATPSVLAEAIQSACANGGWVDRLRLLIAAEEIYAIELGVAVGNLLTNAAVDESGSEPIGDLMSKYATQRQHAEDLVPLLTDVVDRLPAPSRNPANRLVKRKTIHAGQRLDETAHAYLRIVSSTDSTNTEATTWTEAAQSLVALDKAADGADDQANQHRTQSMEDDAKALGALFAQQLPAARNLIDEINSQHPGTDPEARVQIVKRHEMQKLVATAREENSSQLISETVAELAMAIALLRGVGPRTEAEFQDLGKRLLDKAARIANVHARAGVAMPAALAVFGQFTQRVLPYLAEYLFHAIGGIKPARPGAARNAYKFARKAVWGARHDREVADAAAGGAAKAFQVAIDGAVPRLIVRLVDRSLRTSSGK